LYSSAPPGSLLVEGARYPSQLRNYEYFNYVSIADEPPQSRAELMGNPTQVLARWLDDDSYRAGFVILTRSHKAYVDALHVMPPGTLDRIEQALLASARFNLVYASPHAMIFKLNRKLSGGGQWID
jgi:hypothetical protein